MVSKSEFISSDPGSFPGRGEHDLLCNSDVVNLLLKSNLGRGRPNFAILECSNYRWENDAAGSWERWESGKVER